MAGPPPLPPSNDQSGDSPPPFPGSGPPALPVPLKLDTDAHPEASEPEEHKRPTTTKAPPAGRKFPCRSCGAKLDFDPEVRGLKCPYCGFTERIAEADDAELAKVKEHDFEEFLNSQEERADARIEGRASQVRCDGCGAMVLLEDKVVTEKCPYCSTHLINEPEEVHHLIAPESLLPFEITDRDARGTFNRWIHGLWFAPTELKQLANLGQFASVYDPFWTFDSMTYTRYSGMRGDDYTVKESYTDSDGRRQTRSVTRTRWHYVSGEVQHFFDDVLIQAAKTLPKHLVQKIGPWELKSLEPFRDEFLSGHKAERYSVSLSEGFHTAEKVMDQEIDKLIRQDIGGDHQRVHSAHTNHVGVTFKHTLLPIWVANYRYREKVYQVLVNGSSGKLAGDRPWSILKIVRLIVLILAAVGLIIFAISKFQNRRSGPPRKVENRSVLTVTAAADVGDRDVNGPPGVPNRHSLPGRFLPVSG